FWAMRQPGGPLAATSASADLYPLSGSATVLPGEPSGPTDVVLLATDNGSGSKRVVTRVKLGGDLDEGELTWKSDPLPSDVYTASFAADAETVYVGAGDEVRSLSLRTGEERWRASLTDKVTTGCPDCFRIVDGTLVVRTDDSYLTGFSTESSEPRWSRRLASPSAAASIVGGSVLLVDDPPDAQALTEVTTIAPADGKVVRTFAPSCPQSPDTPFPIEMSAGDPVHAVPGTGDLVAAFGFGYGCIVRWEAATGAVRWATPLPDGNFEDEQPPVITATDLVVTKTSGSLRVDLATGRATPLEPVPDADTQPKAVVGTTLLAETTSTRGTTRGGLAAFDLASGRRLWSTQLESGAQPVSRGRYRSSDALFDGSPRTLLVTTGPTPLLLTFEGETREILRQELDVATGELTRGTERQFVSRFGSSGTPSITVESVDARSLLLSVDSIIEVVPLSGEGPIATWPEPR
ncbi:MAG TPA: PQQ-binding-like beta-propeller repeat protein, partial [Aquihabitans sp.]|nr:PQQ-binding-like beta-propeller repeat protein [Aquihabitans sp.]